MGFTHAKLKLAGLRYGFSGGGGGEGGSGWCLKTETERRREYKGSHCCEVPQRERTGGETQEV